MSVTRTVVGVCMLLALPAATALAGPSKKEIEHARKMNPLINGINDATPAVRRDRDSYLRWVNPDTGPTCQEKNMSRPYPLQLAAPFAKDIAAAAKAKPKMKELDAAAAMYAAALAKIGLLWSEAGTYYGERKYKDDACARGKTLHTELMAAWEQFFLGDRGIRAGIQAEEDAADARDLPMLKKKFGQNLRWHHRALLVDAKKILRTVAVATEASERAAAASAPPEKVRGKTPPMVAPDAAVAAPAPSPSPAAEPAPAIDLAAVKAQIDAYTAMAALAKQLGSDKLRLDANVSGFDRMTYPAEQFAKTAAEVLAHLDGSKPYTDSEKKRLAKGDADFPGTFKRLISAYNSMVDMANRVTFSGKMK